MRKVVKFETIDGAAFDNEADALKREQQLKAAEEAHSILGGRVDDTGFGNGDGYLQHDAADILKFYAAVGDIIESFSSKQTADMYRANPQGIVHRYLDVTPRFLTLLLNRSLCFDQSFREWGQPYFAINPTKGQQTLWKR